MHNQQLCQTENSVAASTAFAESNSLSVVPESDIGDCLARRRLDPHARVSKILANLRSGLVVIKPLVESQNALGLLDQYEGSMGLWMFRSYKAVAASNLKYFGRRNGIEDLRPIVQEDRSDWRCERITNETRGRSSCNSSERI